MSSRDLLFCGYEVIRIEVLRVQGLSRWVLRHTAPWFLNTASTLEVTILVSLVRWTPRVLAICNACSGRGCPLLWLVHMLAQEQLTTLYQSYSSGFHTGLNVWNPAHGYSATRHLVKTSLIVCIHYEQITDLEMLIHKSIGMLCSYP